MECRDIRDRLQEYLEGGVPEAGMAEIRKHLGACTDCRKAFSGMEVTLKLIKGLDEVEPPAWLARKVMEEIRGGKPTGQSIWHRLFGRSPLGIPVTAVAAMAVAVTSVVIIKSMGPGLHETPPPVANLVSQTPVADPKQPAEKDRSKLSEPAGGRAAGAPREDSRLTARDAADEAPPQALQRQMPDGTPPPAPALLKPSPPPGALGASGAGSGQASVRDSAQEQKGPRRALNESKEEYAATGRHNFERVVTETYPTGLPAVVLTTRSTPLGPGKVMEERFDEAGLRHGLHLAYDESGLIRAEVLYERGQIRSITEYGPDGSVKKGGASRDWPWLKRP